jgi:methylated-DNA-[protein]-cysteine S-methyltransferase
MNGKCRGHYVSPIGLIQIEGSERGVSCVGFLKSSKEAGGCEGPVVRGNAPINAPACLAECIKQLGEYFSGKRQAFAVKLDLEGTEFQKKCWRALLKIPYGKTVSYGEIASAVGNRKATRAVGGANHRNPVSIIIPCHRVVGADGRLTGYGGGLRRKKWLLDHERRHAGSG